MLEDGYVGRVWLNGEFGLAKEKKYNPQRTIHTTSPEDRRWNAAMLSTHGLEECLRHRGFSLSNLMEGVCDLDHNGDDRNKQEECDRFGLSLLFNSHRRRRGSKGISRYGSKMVRNGAFLMQQEVPNARLSFLTVTLPNVSKEEAVHCSEKWSDIVRVFVQRLRRILRRSRLPAEIVGCTEVQESRAALTGVFALHLHFVFVGRRRGCSWAVTPRVIKEAWQSALSPYLSNDVDSYNWTATENLQRVQKSADGYLGKYMSKGLKATEKLTAMFPGIMFPSAWFVCTNTLRNRVKRQTLRVHGWMGRVFADIVESKDPEFIAYEDAVTIERDGYSQTVGYLGRMTPHGRDALAVWIRSIRSEGVETSIVFGNVQVKEV